MHPTNPQPQQPQPLSNPNNIEREPFRWFFEAHYEDGHVIEQPADDRSIKHVEGAEHNPSAFTDVLDYAKTSPLKAFGLLHSDGKQGVVVDLVTGAFIINGTPFHAHDQFFEPREHEIQLVYHRETRLDHNMKGEVTRHYVNRYFIGWQQVGGKHKAVIAVG